MCLVRWWAAACTVSAGGSDVAPRLTFEVVVVVCVTWQLRVMFVGAPNVLVELVLLLHDGERRQK